MDESGWLDSDCADEESGSHTTLRPVYADQASAYIDHMFSRMAGSPRPASRPAAPPAAAEPAEPSSLLDDLDDMGWFEK